MSIAQTSKLLQNIQMREALLISEIRLKNLTYLVSQSDILQKEFAQSVGTSPNSFNQYLTGHRNIGDRMARKVEERLQLGRGWMDQPHQEEWELSASMYDGRNRNRAFSRVATTLAARIEALADERAFDQITALIELLEERQARTGASHLLTSKRKPD